MKTLTRRTHRRGAIPERRCTLLAHRPGAFLSTLVQRQQVQTRTWKDDSMRL